METKNERQINNNENKGNEKAKIKLYDDIAKQKEAAAGNDDLLFNLNELLIFRNVQEKNISKKVCDIVKVPKKVGEKTLRLVGIYIKGTLNEYDAQDLLLEMKLNSDQIIIVQNESPCVSLFI